ncbi:hypothetical protein TSUD_408260 [Trifolium subterraneum]|uniref:Replication protein A 70 kDa DNA-binding subunit B/D first OB fold domain-containing protein n=1 Tax=Trifolium subterraneum TaxID=3900 RepID=A0A2Z6PIC4_TRISU|nr:hypothetical protein TSUD_408260 [Trifolium subterraneum]
MASRFDMLCDVLPGRDSWKFKVGVLRKWSISSFMKPNEMNSLEMVLIDEKGGKIHASLSFIKLFVCYVVSRCHSNEREHISDGKVTKMVVLELTDTSGKFQCALFGDYVDELQSALAKSPYVWLMAKVGAILLANATWVVTPDSGAFYCKGYDKHVYVTIPRYRSIEV